MSELDNQIANWKAVRARLNPPKPKPPILSIVPPTTNPAGDVMDIIIAAVGNAFSISPSDILRGVSTPDVASARKLAIALSVRKPRFSVERVSDHFEVNLATVDRAVSVLDPILDSYAITRKTPIELSLPLIAKEWAALERVHRRRPSMEEIVNSVSAIFNESVEDIFSTRRNVEASRARQVAMALCKQLTLASLPAIARFFKRDHTTVLHAARRMRPIMIAVAENMVPGSMPELWASRIFEQMAVTPLAKIRTRLVE
jgi:chromosomal replication initiation ATPase DnaA